MKGIIITVLIFISAVVKGQQDSIVSNTSTSGRFIDIDTAKFYPSFSGVYLGSYLDVVRANDTLKCVMLYSDTIQIDINFTPVFIDSGALSPKQIRVGYIKNHIGYAFWQYGYTVYEFIPAHWEIGDNYVISHYEFKSYLDADKKPLPKSIVVWQTINIK